MAVCCECRAGAQTSDEERLEWAFQCVLTNPEYRFGNRLRGLGNPPPPPITSSSNLRKGHGADGCFDLPLHILLRRVSITELVSV